MKMIRKIEEGLRRRRLGIDFDGVIQSKEPQWKNVMCMAEPMPGAVKAIKELKAKGFEIVIHTARPWWVKHPLVFWLKWYKIPYDKIVMGKPICEYYIDDHALEFKDWKKTLKRILK